MAELFAYLSYDDGPAGVAWLESLGFEVVTRQDGDDGALVHCEVRLGDVVLMVASADADYEIPPVRGNSTGGGLYLLADDVDDLHDKAVSAGGHSLFGPEDTEWGARRARVLDPEGHEWTFGTYRPGQSWG